MSRIRKGIGKKGEEHHRRTVLNVRDIARELGYKILSMKPQTEHGCDLVIQNPKNRRLDF